MARGRLPHWLAAIDKIADELDGDSVTPQMTGIDRAAGQDQRVEVIDGSLGNLPIDGKFPGRINIVIDGLDLATLE